MIVEGESDIAEFLPALCDRCDRRADLLTERGDGGYFGVLLVQARVQLGEATAMPGRSGDRNGRYGLACECAGMLDVAKPEHAVRVVHEAQSATDTDVLSVRCQSYGLAQPTVGLLVASKNRVTTPHVEAEVGLVVVADVARDGAAVGMAH